MNAIAIIPARAGSKRIPGKNIKLFAGRPMIEYPIRTALESGLFNRVIVSTENDQIAEVAMRAGAEVPFRRPADLADDMTHTGEVLVHALRALSEDVELPEIFCCIYPTSPFLEIKYLQLGHSLLKDSGADTVIPVTTFSSPILRALRINNGLLESIWPEYYLSRSQDLEESYHDVGQFYWLKTTSFLEGKSLVTTKSIPLVIPRGIVIDIDTPEDWAVAEQIYEFRRYRNCVHNYNLQNNA